MALRLAMCLRRLPTLDVFIYFYEVYEAMNDQVVAFPEYYDAVHADTVAIGFEQKSDGQTGALLASLCASKPGGALMELGTGTGLSTAWMLQGMCAESSLVTIDEQEDLVAVAKRYLGRDSRVEWRVGDGAKLIQATAPSSIDLIFADTWPGKYFHLDQTLGLLKPGGIYLIDDMLPQDNWPEGHADKAEALADGLMSRPDLAVTKLSWSTGLMLCVKA